MLPASVQGQGYRVSNANLDVVTGTKGRLSGRRPFSGTERSTRRRRQSMDRGASVAHVRRWLYKRGLLGFMR